jgi:hypothetical protein
LSSWLPLAIAALPLLTALGKLINGSAPPLIGFILGVSAGSAEAL